MDNKDKRCLNTSNRFLSVLRRIDYEDRSFYHPHGSDHLVGGPQQIVDTGEHIEVRQVQKHEKHPVLESVFHRMKASVANGTFI
jgi:hypothetical protein